jgi:precorrin-6B methylase 2
MSKELLCDQLEIIGAGPSVIFDVGSHTGGSTLEYLVNLPHARVFAFEPAVGNFAATSNALAMKLPRFGGQGG